jgi:hypothetical protein
VAAGSQDQVMLDVPASVTAGQTFTATLRMTASGAIQGLSTQLGWDPAVATPVAMTAGELITSQNGVVFSAQPGNVDAAVLGTNRTIAGEGVVATVTFQALASGKPGVALAKVEARDVANRHVTLTAGAPVAQPTETVLMPVAPNPVRGNATLAFSLARAGKVELAIYSVDGRRVRTLVQDTREPGVYRSTWNGTDDSGNAVHAGVFFARLATASGSFSKALTLVR